MNAHHLVSRSDFPSPVECYLSFVEDFAIHPAAIGAGDAEDGGLAVTEPDPGVHPWHQESLAPAAGETLERIAGTQDSSERLEGDPANQ